jgi:hypothetical protein
MSKSKKKLGEICFEILRELYQNATPQVDFNVLVQNAQIDEVGRKIIPFDDYEIEEEVMIDIVKKHIKKNKLTKTEGDVVKCNVYLGPSPKIKVENYKYNE